MKGFFDVQSPVFRPLWVRAAICAVCAGWGLVELIGGNVFWAVLFGASAAYLGYQFFVVFDPDKEDEK